MAKLTELKERDTGEVIYPKTITTNVYTETGTKLNEELNNKADVSSLSNVKAEQVIDNLLLNEIETLTREEIKKDLFIDMWNTACGEFGTYNKSTGYFKLNGITDIGYDEAIKIYMVSAPKTFAAGYKNLCGAFSGNPTIFQTRTVLPIYSKAGNSYLDLSGMCQDNYIIKIIRFVGKPVIVSTGYFCYNAPNLQHIYGELIVYNVSIDVNTFWNCNALETVYLKECNKNIMLSLPKLSLESLTYLIQNRNGTNAITIKVHSDVYNKLTDETNTEWNNILTLARSKNIQFII